MNKWQYLPRDLWFLKWKALGASSPLADFSRLRTSSEDFGRLWKTSDFFGNLRKWSCPLQKSQHSQDKNLTLISQKKLVGIRQSLLLLTQGNIYNRLTFLNKYLMFLGELNEPFRENRSKFLTAGYLVFWKHFPAAGYLDTSFFFMMDLRRHHLTQIIWVRWSLLKIQSLIAVK